MIDSAEGHTIVTLSSRVSKLRNACSSFPGSLALPYSKQIGHLLFPPTPIWQSGVSHEESGSPPLCESEKEPTYKPSPDTGPHMAVNSLNVRWTFDFVMHAHS